MSTRTVTVEVSSDLYDKFKVFCFKNHSTMKDVFSRLLCDCLKESPVERGLKEGDLSLEDVISPKMVDEFTQKIVDKVNRVRDDEMESIVARMERTQKQMDDFKVSFLRQVAEIKKLIDSKV